MDLRALQDFFDQSQDIIAVLDDTLCYEAANLEYCRYWGVERDALLGAAMESVLGASALNASVRDYLSRCLAGEHVTFEDWFDFPGMGRRFVSVKYAPRQDTSGVVVGIFLISRDITQRKLLQAEVQAERDRFDQVLSSLNVGLVLYNADLSIDWCNRQLLEMFPGAHPYPLKCHEFFQQRTTSCPNCPTLEVFNDGKPHSRDIFVERLGRWYACSIDPIHGKDGSVVKALGHVQDITDQRQSVETLRARDAELRSIFRATRVGIGVVKDRVFTQANDHFFTMLGYSREELIGQDSRIVYSSQEEYEYAGNEVYKRMHGESTAAVEVQLMRKDGSLLDVLITITHMDPEMPSDGATFVVMDITDRKRADQLSLENEQRFRALFESVDMIAVQGYDQDHRVVFWNPASEVLYGYSREEALGQPLEDLIIPGSMKEDVSQLIEAWMSGGAAIPAGELELLHKDGHTVPVYSSHVMQETAMGDKFMYCIDVDLAEIRRIHNQLVSARDDAESANQAKSEFLANMSHEIRTPLNGIQGMLTLMQGTQLDETQQEYAQAGVESAVRLNRLLSDILDLSRVEAGKMVVVNQLFDLPEMVRQVGDLFRLASDETRVSLRFRVADDVSQFVVGDSARLQQVLTNLVGNGLKYTDSGEVQVDVSQLASVREGQCRIHISVEDTGIGIGKEQLDALFEPFTQGSQGYTRQYQGAGLGLSICKRLVGLMGGNMAVDSTVGKGTTIHLVVPFEEGAGSSAPSLAIMEESLPSVGLDILLVEDDRVSSLVGERLLDKMGCRVVTAFDGSEAIEVLRGKTFDAVLMDVQMPILNGIEATKKIRQGEAGTGCRDVPIYALTAYTMAGDREKFLEAGMNGYIAKPVELESLRQVLSEILQKRQDVSG